jgi:xylulose-5-phosphate/fructose-6-phosphate phosphoketolase
VAGPSAQVPPDQSQDAVRGYKEEGTITTPFDMRVQTDLDRFHLVQDVVDRLPNLGGPGVQLEQLMADRLIAHTQYINQHGRTSGGVVR